MELAAIVSISAAGERFSGGWRQSPASQAMRRRVTAMLQRKAPGRLPLVGRLEAFMEGGYCRRHQKHAHDGRREMSKRYIQRTAQDGPHDPRRSLNGLAASLKPALLLGTDSTGGYPIDCRAKDGVAKTEYDRTRDKKCGRGRFLRRVEPGGRRPGALAAVLVSNAHDLVSAGCSQGAER